MVLTTCVWQVGREGASIYIYIVLLTVESININIIICLQCLWRLQQYTTLPVALLLMLYSYRQKFTVAWLCVYFTLLVLRCDL